MERTTEEIIKNIIESSGCINGTKLALDVMSFINPSKFSVEEYSRIMGDLAHKGEISMVTYRTPNSPYPLSVYFPKGTQLRIVNDPSEYREAGVRESKRLKET